MKRIGTFSLVFLVILSLAAEVAIRMSGKFENHNEKTGARFNPFIKEYLTEPWLFVREKHIRFFEANKEYTTDFTANEEGLPGPLPSLKKEKNEFRIVIVGDSVTEGKGDEEKLGLVGRLVRKISNHNGKVKYTFINAGMGGSDPVYGFELLKHRLLKYEPDLVLFMVNSSDLTDLIKRGGFDRFTSDGQLRDRTSFWTPLFNASHLARAFFLQVLEYDWQLKPRSTELQELNNAINGLKDALNAAHQLANEKKFKLMVFIHPLARDIMHSKLPVSLKKIETDLSKNQIEAANLLPFFLERVSPKNWSEYFWPIDRHLNSKGYELLSEAVQFELKKRGLLK